MLLQAETGQSGAGRLRYRHLGAFRLALAFLVVVQHFVTNVAPAGALYDALLPREIGSLAVLIFFCLSGFVITEAAARVYSEKPFAFIANRFLRIVPHYLGALAVSILVHFLFVSRGTIHLSERVWPDPDLFTNAFGIRNIAANLIGFMPGANRLEFFDFIDIVWAVRVEMVFYLLVFACLVVCSSSRIRRTGLLPLAYGVAALLVPVLVLSAIGRLPEKVGLISYFGFGAALFFTSSGKRMAPLVWLSLAGIVLHFSTLPVLNAENGYARDVPLQAGLLALMLALMVVLAFSEFRGFRTADRWLGNLSYPLYLQHQNVEVALYSMAGGFSYGVVFGGIPLAMLFSYGAGQLIDPLVNGLRDRVRGGRLVAPPQLASVGAQNHFGQTAATGDAFNQPDVGAHHGRTLS